MFTSIIYMIIKYQRISHNPHTADLPYSTYDYNVEPYSAAS